MVDEETYVKGVEYCDVDHGTKVLTYEIKRVIINALWYAMNSTLAVINFIGKTIHFFLPSGVKLELYKEGEGLKDFKLPDKRYWAWSMSIFDKLIVDERAIPKHGYKHAFQMFVRPWEPTIGSGEHFFFEDMDTGEWKRGTEFEPVRKYGLVSNGIFDIASVILIVKLVMMLKESGLHKTAFNFLKTIFGGIMSVRRSMRARKQRRQIRKIVDRTDVESMAAEFTGVETKIGFGRLFG